MQPWLFAFFLYSSSRRFCLDGNIFCRVSGTRRHEDMTAAHMHHQHRLFTQVFHSLAMHRLMKDVRVTRPQRKSFAPNVRISSNIRLGCSIWTVTSTALFVDWSYSHAHVSMFQPNRSIVILLHDFLCIIQISVELFIWVFLVIVRCGLVHV